MKGKIRLLLILVVILSCVLTACANQKIKVEKNVIGGENVSGVVDERVIYLAGGCFWGMQAYFDKIDGVLDSRVGYANGDTENPTYEEVCRAGTNHAETLKLNYDANKISLAQLLERYYRVINPTSVNKQGGDSGVQYRTGIYYIDEKDYPIIEKSLAELAKGYDKPIAIELKPLENFYDAEEYHQKYLEKNPGGYCHIDISLADEPLFDSSDYVKPSDDVLRETLGELSYDVTQKSATERPFTSELENEYRQGIYVDITTGAPLFVSSAKFDSGCGWPSFSKPIDESVIEYVKDSSHGMERIEVRSKSGDAHLGHVFNDGPKESGGLRYCINGASLRFIPLEEMEKEGYGKYVPYVE